MRAIPIDDYLEDLESQRGSAAPGSVTAGSKYDWRRIISEGRSARTAADGGRWRIGQLSVLVERRYASGALQRFADEIGETYATVRRYRWVVKAYEPGARFRFESLSFSHFQSVAGLPDRVSWLERAERYGWSVDRLTRESRGTDETDADEHAAVDRLRASIQSLQKWISPGSPLDDAAIAEAGKDWLAQTLDELAQEIEKFRDRLKRATKAASSRGSVSKTRTAALKARAVGR